MWEDSQVALRAPPTAQVAPKVLARGVHALLVLLMRVAQYQVLLSRLCIPVGALGAHSGKRGMLEAKGGADCEGRGSARIVGSLAKRESDMEVKYSPQSLKSKERPITGVHSTRKVCMRPFDRSCLPFLRLSFGLTIRCPKRPRWGRSVRWPYPQQGRLKRGSLTG